MSEFEKELLARIEKLERENLKLQGLEENTIPTYQYSKIRDIDLRNIVNIEENFEKEVFNNWFENKIEINNKENEFLLNLIKENENLIRSYNEEDLKMKFIAPLLNKINFKSIEKKFRDFYEIQLTYKTESFILTGITDFVVSKGLTYSQKPYFFIQEFKRSEEYSNPRPQLLAELISAIELNNWNIIKGAYIIGENWVFVVLKRIGKYQYEYFISQNFDSTKIEDLKSIYKNLLFVKNEIIKKVENGE